MSLDLPSDVARASLSDVPNSFYLQADRTHSSDDGVLCSSRRLHGLSRPDTALCPLISRGWRPVGPVRQLRELSHCRQLGSSWSGPQSRCSSIGGQGSPVPTWWATVELRVEPSPTIKTLPQSTQAPPACHPGYSYIPAPARSLVRILGGSQSGGCPIFHCFWGVLWVRAFPELGALPQDSTPTTFYYTRQIRITLLVLIYVSVNSWNDVSLTKFGRSTSDT